MKKPMEKNIAAPHQNQKDFIVYLKRNVKNMELFHP